MFVYVPDAVHRVTAAEMALLVPKGIFLFPDNKERLQGTIDVWWIMRILTETCRINMNNIYRIIALLIF